MMVKIVVLAIFITISSFNWAFCSANRNADIEERSLSNENVRLQQMWHEWDYCTNALSNDFFTPMTEFVPDRVLFLATYKDCKKLFHKRTVTIAKGKQTIFFPLFFGLKLDYSDDWLTGKCPVNTPEEAEAGRFTEATSEINTLKSANFTSKLYLKMDGVRVTPIFVSDAGSCPYHLIGCRDGRTYQNYSIAANLTGDPCDEPAFQPFNGLDAYPMYGWWGKDKRKWKSGETHTFQFGVRESVALGGPPGCFTAKYVITAK
jgi:hypothetical protein